MVVGVTGSSAQTARRFIFNLVLFGIAFGYLEAAVVVYLRVIGGPLRVAAGLSAQDLFPLLRLDRLAPSTLALVRIELAREASTLILIWAVSRQARSRLAAFVLTFGVWDLTFYLWLRLLVGWPPSLLTWDLLFLLPVPWAAPVLAPSIVAATMIAFGAWILLNEPLPREPRSAKGAARTPKTSQERIAPRSVLREFLSRTHALLPTLLLTAGAAVILISFVWDWRRWLAGGMPRAFPWMIFALGEALAIAGFLGFSSSGIL